MCDLIEPTLRLIERVPRTVKQKDIAIGAGVTNSWLSRFIKKTNHPNPDTVKRLHDYLAGLYS